MKPILFSVLIVWIVFAGCKKENVPDPPQNNTPQFEYISLVAQDTTIVVNGFTNIKATAVGDSLTYTWSYEAGAIVGNGSDVQFTVCHTGKFLISCEVQDAHSNKATKYLYIYSK